MTSRIASIALAILGGSVLLFGSISKLPAQDPKGASSGEFKANISKILEGTRQRAKSLIDRHASINAALERINKDANSAELSKVLQETLDLANGAVEIFAPENEIWKQLDDTMKIVEARIANAQERLKSDVRWAQIQKEWQARRDVLQQIRTELLKQRDAAKARLDKIVADRDLILEQLTLARLDAAIEELKAAAKDMEGMAGGLQSILDKLAQLNAGS